MIQSKWLAGSSNIDDALKIRKIVFFDEQKIEESDSMDSLDSTSLHVLIYENDIVCGCGRLTDIGNSMFRISKIAVLKEKRGNDYGDFIVRLLIRKAFDLGALEVIAHVQMQAKGFYEKLGFISEGEEFIQSGVLHIKMKRHTDVSGNC